MRCDRLKVTIPDLVGSARRIGRGCYDDEMERVLAAVLQQAMRLDAMPLEEFIRTLRDLEAGGLLEELQKRL